ncbi:unnamed protein product [Linum trigynum]|uniref:Transcription factor RAX2 n=1 Tax=Linum trigynum TaxID=586398 RepID=A0AAV2G328_9ROSI
MGRAPCCDKANVKKGPWSPEEDAKLKEYIEKSGTGGNWIALPQKAGLKRCGKSCRLRWLNYLRPNIKHGEFSDEEDKIICTLFATIGSRWSIIAAQLPGRTDNDIKNYWNTKLKKKLMSMAPPPPPHSHSQFPSYHHHQRKPFPSPSPSSLLYSPLSAAPQTSPFMKSSTGFDMISPLLQSNHLLGTTSSSSLFQSLQEAGNNNNTFLNTMQYYNNNNSSCSSNLLVFGSGGTQQEASAGASCSSNSDGSCGGQQGLNYGTSFVKQEMSGSKTEVGDHSKFMFNYLPTNISNNGGGYQAAAMADHHHHHNQNLEEQVKQLIITQSCSDEYPDNNNGLLLGNVVDDDNKAVQEKLMYYYY